LLLSGQPRDRELFIEEPETSNRSAARFWYAFAEHPRIADESID
jgi:hypothetical protein